MDRGRLATAVVVLAVAGVAGASLVAGHGDGAQEAAPATAALPTPTASADARRASVGVLADRLGRLPEVAPGAFAGRIHRRLAACHWAATDLATGAEHDLTPPGRCPLWRPGWRYAFQFSVEQSANAPIVRAVDVLDEGRVVGHIEVPHEPTGGAAGTPDGDLALCIQGERAQTRLYRGAREVRRVAACGPVAFGDEFLFRDQGRFRDADGRVVLDFAEPAPFVQPVVNGLVVAAAAGEGEVDVYRGRRLVRTLSLPDDVTADGILQVDASADGATVVLRLATGDLVVLRAGAPDVERTDVGTVEAAYVAPDGRSIAATIAGVPVILDAATLVPAARLPFEPGAVLAAWTA